MKKLTGILIFICLFFNNIAVGETRDNLLKFNEWLNINGYEQYLDKDKFIEIQDKSICNPNVPQVCVDSDGKFIPYEQYKYKRMYQNNLKIKLNKKKK